jgi:gas vesicle protein
MQSRRRGTVHSCTQQGLLIRFICTGNEKEAIMKITSLTLTLVAAMALAALGQEGTLEDVKHGAKKAGETVKNGLETAGKKTKEVAETVGEKTKETAKTVGRKTKETAETVGEKTKDSARTVHRDSKKAVQKVKAETSGQQSTNHAPNTPSPTDR